MKKTSNVSKKRYILLQKLRSNSYYFGCSQGTTCTKYCLYQILSQANTELIQANTELVRRAITEFNWDRAFNMLMRKFLSSPTLY